MYLLTTYFLNHIQKCSNFQDTIGPYSDSPNGSLEASLCAFVLPELMVSPPRNAVWPHQQKGSIPVVWCRVNWARNLGNKSLFPSLPVTLGS